MSDSSVENGPVKFCHFYVGMDVMRMSPKTELKVTKIHLIKECFGRGAD